MKNSYDVLKYLESINFDFSMFYVITIYAGRVKFQGDFSKKKYALLSTFFKFNSSLNLKNNWLELNVLLPEPFNVDLEITLILPE